MQLNIRSQSFQLMKELSLLRSSMQSMWLNLVQFRLLSTQMKTMGASSAEKLAVFVDQCVIEKDALHSLFSYHAQRLKDYFVRDFRVILVALDSSSYYNTGNFSALLLKQLEYFSSSENYMNMTEEIFSDHLSQIFNQSTLLLQVINSRTHGLLNRNLTFLEMIAISKSIAYTVNQLIIHTYSFEISQTMKNVQLYINCTKESENCSAISITPPTPASALNGTMYSLVQLYSTQWNLFSNKLIGSLEPCANSTTKNTLDLMLAVLLSKTRWDPSLAALLHPESSYIAADWQRCIFSQLSPSIASYSLNSLTEWTSTTTSPTSQLFSTTNSNTTLFLIPSSFYSPSIAYYLVVESKGLWDNLNNRALRVFKLIDNEIIRIPYQLPTPLPPIETPSSKPTGQQPIFSCQSGRYGPNCDICPVGTWSDDGYLHICANAPVTATYTRTGETSSNCEFTCNDKEYFKLGNVCTLPPFGKYTDGSSQLRDCLLPKTSPSIFASLSTLYYFTSSGTHPTSCGVLPRYLIMLDTGHPLESFLSTSFTLEVWFKLDPVSLQTTVNEDSNGVGIGLFEFPSQSDYLNPLLACYLIAGGNITQYWGALECRDWTGNRMRSNQNFALDYMWHHVAFVYSHRFLILSLVLDGNTVGTSFYSHSLQYDPPLGNNTMIAIGGAYYNMILPPQPPSLFRFFPGLLDDIRVYKVSVPLENLNVKILTIERESSCQFPSEEWSINQCIKTCGFLADYSDGVSCTCRWGQYFTAMLRQCIWCPQECAGSSYPRNSQAMCDCIPGFIKVGSTCLRGKDSLPAPNVTYVFDAVPKAPTGSTQIPLDAKMVVDLSRIALALESDRQSMTISLAIWVGFDVLLRQSLNVSILPFEYIFTRVGDYRVQASIEHPMHNRGSPFNDAFSVRKRFNQLMFKPENCSLMEPSVLQLISLDNNNDDVVIVYSLDKGEPSLVYSRFKPPIIVPPVVLRAYAQSSPSFVSYLASQELVIEYQWSPNSSFASSSSLPSTDNSNSNTSASSNNTIDPTSAPIDLPTNSDGILVGVVWCQQRIPICIGIGVGTIVLWIGALVAARLFYVQIRNAFTMRVKKNKKLKPKLSTTQKKEKPKKHQAKAKLKKKQKKSKRPEVDNIEDEPIELNDVVVKTALSRRKRRKEKKIEKSNTPTSSNSKSLEQIKCQVCRSDVAIQHCWTCKLYCCPACTLFHQKHNLIRVLVCDFCLSKQQPLCYVVLLDEEKILCSECQVDLSIRPTKNDPFRTVPSCEYCEEQVLAPTSSQFCLQCKELLML